MMRRISLVAASAAMLAVSALPASAATMGSTTHKLSFPATSGLKASGTYTKVAKGIKVNVCAKDTSKGTYAVGAVVVASNSSYKMHANLGAVAFGDHATICRSMTLRFTSHLQVYSFAANNKGMMTHKSKLKKIY